jgi:D-alanine-D-alanine ligase
MKLENSGMRLVDKKVKVTVLAGGPSRERPVSQVSGKAVAEALMKAGYQVTMADIGPNDLSALDVPADVIFPVLHGAFGEDGQIQAILESRGLAYCGSGPKACRLSMNKYDTKVRLMEMGISTPAFDYICTAEDVEKVEARWSIPAVVKPVEEGSSFGISIVKDVRELGPVMARTLEEFGPSLVEEFIDGRELTVGILDNKALPIIEICSSHSFYDYDAKYSATDTRYEFIEDLPAALYGQLQEQSVEAARGMGLRDFCRVDWRLDRVNNPYVLEINAIPGFTDHSLLPKAAAKSGVDMASLCGRIVEMALSRGGTRMGKRELHLRDLGKLHGENENKKENNQAVQGKAIGF